jgi:hypothetical protein
MQLLLFTGTLAPWCCCRSFDHSFFWLIVVTGGDHDTIAAPFLFRCPLTMASTTNRISECLFAVAVDGDHGTMPLRFYHSFWLIVDRFYHSFWLIVDLRRGDRSPLMLFRTGEGKSLSISISSVLLDQRSNRSTASTVEVRSFNRVDCRGAFEAFVPSRGAFEAEVCSKRSFEAEVRSSPCSKQRCV